MARNIGFVDNSGLTWRIMDENGGCISQKYFQPGSELVGYTSKTYSVKYGRTIVVYDAESNQMSSRYINT